MTQRPRLHHTLILAAVVAVLVIGASACSQVNLSTALKVTDISTGYYDDGIKDGKTHLLPAITFQLHNETSESIRSVQLTVSFWRDGDDGETDSVLVAGIQGPALAAGASTEPIAVRATVGYTLEGARADFFTHALFKDFTAKVFAVRAGRFYKLGEYKLDHNMIPHITQ